MRWLLLLLFVAGAVLVGRGIASGASPPAVVNADIRLIEPRSTRIAALPAITVEVAGGAGSAVVLVDGVDVSGLVTREGDRLTYRPEAPPEPGPHRVEVLATGPAGAGRADWTLVVVASSGAGGRGEVYSHSALSFTAGRAWGDGGSATRTNGNLAVNVGARSGDTEVSFETDLAYANTASAQNLAPSGYLLQLKHARDRLAVGDVTFTGTPLTVPSLARRGALADVRRGRADLQLVQVNSKPVVGWKTGLGSDNQIQGAAFTYGDPPGGGEGGTRVTAVVLGGEILNDNSASVASIEPPSRGQVAGVQGTGRAAGFGYNAELGVSSYDADTTDAVSAKRDVAAGLQLDRVVGGVSLGASYLRAGTDYASIANPGATFDREQAALSAGTALGPSSLSATVSRSRDNLEHDASRPIVYSDNVGLTYALAPRSWPALSLSYGAGRVQSDSEPPGAPKTDIDTQSLTGGLSLARRGWATNLTLNGAWINDPVNGDTDSRSAALSVNVQARDRLSLVPTATVTRSKHAAVEQETDLATLTLTWRVSDALGLSGQAAWVKNATSDDSVENNQRSAVVRLAWDVSDLFRRAPTHPQASLSVSYSGTENDDHIDPAGDRTDHTVLFGLNLSAPLEGSHPF